jgi:serine/threonine-protein kinase
MAHNNRILQLVEEALYSERTPEEVCADSPELLADVRAGLDECRRVELMFEGMFPAAPTERILSPQSQAGAPLPEIPGYEVLAVLGRGGHGIVYRVRHLKLKRLAALKMLLTGQYASPAELARFMREAEAIAALQHPNIVQIYDIGEVDGRPYFTMEFVSGGSLAQKLSGVPQPAQYSASVTENLARAVHTAHVAGIIHRDVKPSNVLLTLDASPKISDFGLARYLEGQSDVTLGPAKVGTPSYMAPEQVAGKPGTVGPLADIYGLGATLYELLTGRPPFRGDTSAETERQLLAQEPVPPSRLNSKVPRDLETICLKCLQKEPARRYESAAALADDLVRYREGRPIRARRIGWAARSWRWSRRKPAAAAVVAMAFVLFGSAVGGGLWAEKQRTARRMDTFRHDAELRNEIGTAVAQAISLRGGFHFNEARALLDEAHDRLGQAGPDDLRRQLDLARADLDLAQLLDNARSGALALSSGTSNIPQAESLYSSAFADAGFGREGDDINAVAARIQQSPLRAEIIAALDDWSSIAPDLGRLTWIQAVARGADADPARNSLRQPELWVHPDQLIRLAQALKPGELSPQLAVALARRARRGRADAVPLLIATQIRFPQDFWVYVELVMALCESHRYDEALGYSRAALALRPDTTAAQYNVGAVLEGLGRGDEAVAYFRESLRLDPTNPWAHANLASVLNRQGKVDEALAHFRQAVLIEPKGTVIWFNFGLALRDIGRSDEAIDCFRQIIGLDPKDATARCQLGATLRDMGRAQEAIDYFEQALRLDPKLATAQAGLQTSLFAAGRAAILMASGQSAAAEPLTESERAGKRRRALAWLRANLALRAQTISEGRTSWSVEPWQIDRGLASVRDPQELAKIPDDEREQWRRFWTEVATISTSNPLEHGRALAASGQWTEAADSYALAFKSRPPNDGHSLFEYAALSLLKGDRSTYTKTCDRMVELFDKSAGVRAYHVARASTLTFATIPDPFPINHIADKELKAAADQYWSMTEQGALAYRAGKFQDAVPFFQRSLAANLKPGVAVVNWLWLALADQGLGKTEDARRWLQKAQTWLDQFHDGMPPNAETELGLHFHNWLEANVLRREAEALISAK